MRTFASALLSASAIATTVLQLALECNDTDNTAGNLNAAHCVDVNALVGDYTTQIEAVKTAFDLHAADTTIHSSDSSEDLPGEMSDSSSSTSSGKTIKYTFSFDSFSFGKSSHSFDHYKYLLDSSSDSYSHHSYHHLYTDDSSDHYHHYKPRRPSYKKKKPVYRPP